MAKTIDEYQIPPQGTRFSYHLEGMENGQNYYVVLDWWKSGTVNSHAKKPREAVGLRLSADGAQTICATLNREWTAWLKSVHY